MTIKRAAGRAVDRRKVMRLDPSMLNDGAITESTAEGSRSADCFANETTAIDGLKIAAWVAPKATLAPRPYFTRGFDLMQATKKSLALVMSIESIPDHRIIQSFEAGLAFGYTAMTARA